MKRSIKAALAIALVALAVPAAALATRHDGRSQGRHVHQFQTGQSGASGGTTVGSFDQSSGLLTLDLASGGSVTGTVGFGTHIVCLGDWRRFFFHGRGRFGHRRFATLTRTTLKRDGDHHGNWGTTGQTGATGSTGGTGGQGSQGGQGSGNGYPHHGSTGGRGDQGSGQGDNHHRFHNDGNGGPQHERCDSSLLIQGVSILNASLEVTSRGAEFGEITVLPAVQ
ncbi:MAG TPA: hypothetical protein VHX66_11770 [Solirubrobacteraceae bacterium]|jgi:hypothetical protein|nr:hypothetical protein [Solirubrobacteraceae bacterium]